MRKFFLVALLVNSLYLSSAKAEISAHEDFVHFTAHFGISYTINTATYGLLHTQFKMNRGGSIALAALTTLGVGLLYKLTEDSQPEDYRKASFRNSLGVAASIGSILVFRF